MSILMDAIMPFRKIIKNLESVPVMAIASAWDMNQARELSYCDSPPCQNVVMKFGKHVDSIMIQHTSKFCGMSMKIG